MVATTTYHPQRELQPLVLGAKLREPLLCGARVRLCRGAHCYELLRESCDVHVRLLQLARAHVLRRDERADVLCHALALGNGRLEPRCEAL